MGRNSPGRAGGGEDGWRDRLMRLHAMAHTVANDAGCTGVDGNPAGVGDRDRRANKRSDRANSGIDWTRRAARTAGGKRCNFEIATCILIAKTIKYHFFPYPGTSPLGNVWHPSGARQHCRGEQPLHYGDTIRFEVEVDSTFSPDAYEIAWAVANISNGERGSGPVFNLTLGHHHVATEFSLQVMLTSNKAWHRLQNCDAYATMSYQVLPIPA